LTFGTVNSVFITKKFEQRLDSMTYMEVGEVIIANAKGNPVITKLKDGTAKTILWDANGNLPIAQMVGPMTSSVDLFYQGFEETMGNSSLGNAMTGLKSSTNGYSATVTGLVDGKNYTLSYWSNSGNGWTQTVTPVTSSGGSYPINIASPTQVDEVRLYPT
jgi:hypothetical protein